jgi:hypothetical protein
MLFVVHRMKWMAVMLAALVLVTLAMAEGEIWEEDDHEVLIRSERGAKNRGELLVQLKLNSVALVRERTIPTELPPFVGEVVPTFADIGCCEVSATDPHGR